MAYSIILFLIHTKILQPLFLKTKSEIERSEIDDALSTVKGAYWEINYLTKEENLSHWFLDSLGHNPIKFNKITDFRKIVHPEDHHKLNSAWREFAKSGYKQEFDCTFKYLTKRKTLVETWARGKVIEFGHDGKPTKFVGIQLNVSKIRKINKDLQRITKIIYKQSKEIKDFASITSHNLRSPMSNLLTLVNFYSKSTSDDDKSEIFSMIKKASSKLAEIINDLGNILSIAAVPDSQQERLTFKDLWNKIKNLLAGDLTETGAEIKCLFKIPSMVYPKTYMESIFLNLLSNSIKYRVNQRKLQIKIKTWQIDGKVWMSYEDNGVGIDLKRYGQKIFGYGKTFHVHPEAKGIGLFITKLQIESMGGHIEVDSKLGEWTRFTICFYT